MTNNSNNQAPTSRAQLAHRAARPSMRGKMMLSGVAGAGKTQSALVVGRTLAGADGKIVLIDTEEASALTYADDNEFDHLPWAPPYSPRDLTVTLYELAEVYDVIVVDSLSHFWHGEGGTLDVVDGRFGGWKVATPMQDDMVRAILRSDAHVIACVREKRAYVVTEKGGKQQIEKLGMEPKQRDDLDYEFNVGVSLSIEHVGVVTKSRCPVLPVGMQIRPHHMVDFAETYGSWLQSGSPTITALQVAELIKAFEAITSKATRTDVKTRFVSVFGQPDQIVEDSFDEAVAWIAEQVAQTTIPDNPEFDVDPDDIDPTPPLDLGVES